MRLRSAIQFSPALLLALAGCTVGPDHAPPAAPTPAAWASPLEAGATADAGDISKWWTVLADPALDSLIARSLLANHDLRESAARLDEARAQRGVVSARLGPQVDATGSYDRTRASGKTGTTGPGFAAPGSERDRYQAGFDANWEIDIFGRIRRGIEAADADIDAAVENTRAVRVSIVAEVARNYAELRAFQRRAQLARANAGVQDETLTLVKARRDAGLTNDLDVARAEANLASTRAAIPLLDAGTRTAAYRLSVLIGRPPGELVAELTGADAPGIAHIPAPAALPEVPMGLPSELLQRRPDVRSAERAAAAANARIGEATADLFPRFSITGTFGFSSRQIGDLGSSESRFWSFGPGTRWPILEWGRIRQNINVQDARHEQTLIRFEKTVLLAFEEVENALTNYARARDRRESLTMAVASDQRAVDLSQDLYSKGLADFLSVLDSQRQLFLQQDLLAQSENAVTANLIALYKALGGGWDTPAQQPPSNPQAAAAPLVSSVEPVIEASPKS